MDWKTFIALALILPLAAAAAPDYDTESCNAVYLVQIIAGAIATIVVAINGIKFIISEDPHARDEARTGVWYGIVGGIIVVIAPYLVGTIMGVPNPCP